MPYAVVTSRFCAFVNLAPGPIQIPPGDSRKKFAGADNEKGLLRKDPDPLVTPKMTFFRPWVSSLTLLILLRVSKELSLCNRFDPDLLPPLMAQLPAVQLP